MSYLYLTQNAALLDYQENAMSRVESWILDDYIYECHWSWSNDGAIPNTMYKKELK